MSWSVGAGLEGQGVIVTGATGGIGAAVTRAFASTGAKVLAVDREQTKLDVLLNGLEGEGHVSATADLVRLDAHAGLLDQAAASFGRAAFALVHLAAIQHRRRDIDEVTEDDWDEQVDTNLKASFFLCRSFAQRLVAQGGGGRIITFASQAWWTGGSGGTVVYSATKGGIVTMTRGLARTYGPHRITVNAVAPGQVHTPMLMTNLPPELYEAIKKQTPLGYVAEPDEIAGTVVFLASRHAGYITGATINISGGYLMY
jgi:NAD(P)-dependent dehydrogenase (short-subunit alcohol dehydrogenase family)